jgi:hypothetical protein
MRVGCEKGGGGGGGGGARTILHDWHARKMLPEQHVRHRVVLHKHDHLHGGEREARVGA